MVHDELDIFIKKIIRGNNNPPSHLNFYSYMFPNGKVYIGYTSLNLNIAYLNDKFSEASPVCHI